MERIIWKRDAGVRLQDLKGHIDLELGTQQRLYEIADGAPEDNGRVSNTDWDTYEHLPTLDLHGHLPNDHDENAVYIVEYERAGMLTRGKRTTRLWRKRGFTPAADDGDLPGVAASDEFVGNEKEKVKSIRYVPDAMRWKHISVIDVAEKGKGKAEIQWRPESDESKSESAGHREPGKTTEVSVIREILDPRTFRLRASERRKAPDRALVSFRTKAGWQVQGWVPATNIDFPNFNADEASSKGAFLQDWLEPA